ncbi:MAG: DNA helicase UvrD, partial [Oscillospiraceae bacterium]|nr:DNA helicase UvrD [Oscillospiraceae bacterium]
VFLCGMNEGVFPSRKTKDLMGMEEERRLAFVAVTRAEKRLFLSGAEGRNFDGSPRYPSRFVLDIDPTLLQFVQKPNEALITDAREYINHTEKFLPEDLQSSILAEGTRVKHEYLGEGTILSVDMDKNAYMVQFASVPTPRRIAFRAKLETL